MEQTLCRSKFSLLHNNKVTKRKLKSKAVTIIDPVTGWFKITQYDDKIVIQIVNLVEAALLTRYHISIEITYDQGLEYIDHGFRKPIIEKEYGITAKPSTLRNPTSNAILDQIHQVLGTYCGLLTLQKLMLKKITHGWAFYLQ